jgi:SAM-dependent methyltransferase
MRTKDRSMNEPQFRFDDAAAYERRIGEWSKLAGAVFLDWLASRNGLRWLDVGCGSATFTELIIAKHAPAEVQGIDPSDAQLAFARARSGTQMAEFRKGDAMALPFEAAKFDVATMALVIFFVPEPAKGVAEMVRVVAPGGEVAAYAWDFLAGGSPSHPILAEMEAIGFPPVRPPSPEASKMESLRKLWTGAGLVDVETRRIDVQRTFTNFDDYWEASTKGGTVVPFLASMSPDDVNKLKARVRARLKEDGCGAVTGAAWANAVKGRLPG